MNKRRLRVARVYLARVQGVDYKVELLEIGPGRELWVKPLAFRAVLPGPTGWHIGWADIEDPREMKIKPLEIVGEWPRVKQ